MPRAGLDDVSMSWRRGGQERRWAAKTEARCGFCALTLFVLARRNEGNRLVNLRRPEEIIVEAI